MCEKRTVVADPGVQQIGDNYPLHDILFYIFTRQQGKKEGALLQLDF